MPPKPKLNKDKGKLKSLPKSSPSQLNTVEHNESEPSTSEEDMKSQFEVELLWCIQQLQTALNSGKLNPRQVQDTTKALNTLMNNSAPLIRKRQLMRLSFGDYRAKMAAEEKKYSKINNQIKLTPGKPSKKSVFIKKAPFLTSDKNFKFSFQVPSDDEQEADISKLNLDNKENNKIPLNVFHFQPSNNEFRFNFSDISNE